MTESECHPLSTRADVPEAEPVDAAGRVRAVVESHYDFVWRTLQYLGMSEANAQDGAQQVMCVLARKITEIERGAETAFLFGTARRVASEWRRNTRRRPPAFDVVELDGLVANGPAADELLDQSRAREVLSKVLEAIPVDLRMVFVLFEIEELSMPAIAELLEIPVGTVASRLRRARETFETIVARMQRAPLGSRGDR